MDSKGVGTRLIMRATLTKNLGKMTKDLGKEVAEAQQIPSLIESTLKTAAAGSATAAVAGIAMAATIEALKIGYDAYKAHQAASQDDHALFEQDYNAGTVSFSLPDKEEDRSNSQKFFHNFILLLQGDDQGPNSPLFRYAGISITPDVPIKKHSSWSTWTVMGKRYSLISMAKLAFSGPYEDADSGDELLDIALRGSDFFLQDRLPRVLSEIHSFKGKNLVDQTFTTTSKLVNGLNLVRFMIIAFANLLINAQQPADLNAATDIPLNDDATIALDKEINKRINVLLLEQNDEKYSYMRKLYCKESFESFIRLVKREVEELQEGYESKVLNQLNLKALIAQSRGILQVLNGLWHQILYLNKSLSKPVQLNYLIRSLSNAMDDDPRFWEKLPKPNRKLKSWPKVSGLNETYSTVVDLVGLYTSLSNEQQKEWLEAMETCSISPTIRQALAQLSISFIEPLHAELAALKQYNAAQAFLMSLIAISNESYPTFLQEAVIKLPGRLKIQQQFAMINRAHLANATPHFAWHIFDCFATSPTSSSTYNSPSKSLKKFLEPETIVKFKALLKAQYAFLEAVRAVSEMQDVLDSNRNILLRKNIRRILKNALLFLRDKESKLWVAFQQLTDQVSKKDKIDDQVGDTHSNLRRGYITNVESGKQGLHERMDFVREEITRTIDVLDSPEFVKRIEHDLIQDVEEAAYTSYAGFAEVKQSLLQALQIPETSASVKVLSAKESAPQSETDTQQDNSSTVSTASVHGNDASNNLHDDASVLADNPPVGNLSPPLVITTNLQLQFILKYGHLVSAGLLFIGMAILLALTFGTSSLPIITSLNTKQFIMAGTISSTATVVGGIGLGLSYFFKPAVTEETNSGNSWLNLGWSR